MNTAAPTPPLAAVMKISGFVADVIFLTQLAAPVGLLLWIFAGQSDGAGFVMIAGVAAGLIAFFAFVLFGVLSWFGGAAAFWSTLHPLNVALPLLALSGGYMMQSEQWEYGVLAAAGGFVLARVCGRRLSGSPQTQLGLCLGLLLLPAIMHWRYGVVTASGSGVFMLTLWLRYSARGDAPLAKSG